MEILDQTDLRILTRDKSEVNFQPIKFQQFDKWSNRGQLSINQIF